MFGEPTAEVPAPAPRVEDPLSIGGRMIVRFEALFLDDTDLDEQTLSMPNVLDVYLDARPNPRLRMFFQTRLNYDPTLPAPFDQPQPTVDQLWIKFDTARRVFWTIGAQPVRWGTGRIWNPTDVVNRTRLNPLSPIDFRIGVPMVRGQIPIEAIGGAIHALAGISGVQKLGDVWGAARLEAASQTAEFSLSIGKGRGRPLSLGADLSTAVGPLDLYAEVAISHGPGVRPTVDREDDWIPQAVVGAEWPIPYGDNDTAILGIEYFFNDAGFADSDDYDSALLGGRFTPLYMGQHYVGAYLALLAPGDWNDSSVILNALYNTDGTGIARVNMSYKVLTHLSVEPFASVTFGPEGGEFRYRVDLPQTDEGPGLMLPPLIAQVGVWLRAAL